MKVKELIERHLDDVRGKISNNEIWIKEAEEGIEKKKKRIQELEEAEADLKNHLTFTSETFVSIEGGNGTSIIRACPCGSVTITSECINVQEVKGEYI
ncbi:hypothetical protein [Sutcliffiella sp. FSL R7-0096]|uniref:hypothetical protein n=1 Tax=Sutcliffiella sp. FSL R7-0096 TaxID=2921670 RepID=UPI003159AE8D